MALRASGRARGSLLAPLAAAALIAAACSGGGGDAPPPSAPATSAPATATQAATPTVAATAASYGFRTGPAVSVAADYRPPGDRVPSTGAYLPANGKPTLVFVDAIW